MSYANGIHHVTAIAGPAQRNLAFYGETLGLRLVKRTVNFDDPTTWHLYFGDEAGSPGTIMTFFPWAHAASGRVGIGQSSETAFRVPESALGYWTHRFLSKGVSHGSIVKRLGDSVLPFKDPDGTILALVGVSGIGDEPFWPGGEIPAESAIRGFHGVTLLVAEGTRTGAVLTDVLGFERDGSEGATVRYRAPMAGMGGVVDVRAAGGFLPGRTGAGSVHHVAFRAADDAMQADMTGRLVREHGLHVTEQRDRHYFRSVYFREPGGVLFEIATDRPGFTIDEPVATLGTALKLPPFLEDRHEAIAATLPTLATEEDGI
ncbi:ring-cleaving dioxygenase [Marinivivus vitaminiproducens]|uniref:ring-cleaving dioxygenase n=1 Tax=Marinivivus vitaminiproducens TaxID=3035935 RepID=UPI00279D246E|nr:ring-cleaving dioxygenase [Geminicoccaceae bacterium SCSIO 64248]